MAAKDACEKMGGKLPEKADFERFMTYFDTKVLGAEYIFAGRRQFTGQSHAEMGLMLPFPYRENSRQLWPDTLDQTDVTKTHVFYIDTGFIDTVDNDLVYYNSPFRCVTRE
jgi:hypothetical protein